MENGQSGIPGLNVMLIVDLESKQVKGTVQSPFHPMVANHVKERGKEWKNVKKDLAQVGKTIFIDTPPYIFLWIRRIMIDAIILLYHIVNCGWSKWGQWSKCSATCGDNGSAGIRERYRHIAIEAQHGGLPCEADTPKETEECIHCKIRPDRQTERNTDIKHVWPSLRGCRWLYQTRPR